MHGDGKLQVGKTCDVGVRTEELDTAGAVAHVVEARAHPGEVRGDKALLVWTRGGESCEATACGGVFADRPHDSKMLLT